MSPKVEKLIISAKELVLRHPQSVELELNKRKIKGRYKALKSSVVAELLGVKVGGNLHQHGAKRGLKQVTTGREGHHFCVEVSGG